MSEIVKIKTRTILEAIQFNGTRECAEKIIAFCKSGEYLASFNGGLYIQNEIDFEKVNDRIRVGDWVVKYSTGNCGRVSEKEFEKSYEIVEEITA